MNQNVFRKIVENEFNLNIDLEVRKYKYVVARSCYYYLCRNLLKLSYQSIAESVNKGHATVIHALKEFQYILADDKLKGNIYNEKFDKILLLAKNTLAQEKINMTVDQLVHNYNYYMILSDKRLKKIKYWKKKYEKLQSKFDDIIYDQLANTE